MDVSGYLRLSRMGYMNNYLEHRKGKWPLMQDITECP